MEELQKNTIQIVIDTPSNGWSHLVSSDIKSLHDFAERIGLKKYMFENKRGKKQPHYDINSKYFELAIKAGVKLITRKELFNFLKKTYG